MPLHMPSMIVRRSHISTTHKMVRDAFRFILNGDYIDGIFMEKHSAWRNKDAWRNKEYYWQIVIEFKKYDFTGHQAESDVRAIKEIVEGRGGAVVAERAAARHHSPHTRKTANNTIRVYFVNQRTRKYYLKCALYTSGVSASFRAYPPKASKPSRKEQAVFEAQDAVITAAKSVIEHKTTVEQRRVRASEADRNAAHKDMERYAEKMRLKDMERCSLKKNTAREIPEKIQEKIHDTDMLLEYAKKKIHENAQEISNLDKEIAEIDRHTEVRAQKAKEDEWRHIVDQYTKATEQSDTLPASDNRLDNHMTAICLPLKHFDWYSVKNDVEKVYSLKQQFEKSYHSVQDHLSALIDHSAAKIEKYEKKYDSAGLEASEPGVAGTAVPPHILEELAASEAAAYDSEGEPIDREFGTFW